MSEIFGIEVKFKAGYKDWYDPCTEFPEDINGFYTIDNGCYKYEIPVVDVESISKYDLCKTCETHTRTYDCTDEECNNPRFTLE